MEGAGKHGCNDGLVKTLPARKLALLSSACTGSDYVRQVTCFCISCPELRRSVGLCLSFRWSALAVAMVLSIASAIPIVFVCRLPECARQSKA